MESAKGPFDEALKVLGQTVASGAANGGETKKNKASKKKNPERQKELETAQLSTSEMENTRLFQLIDAMHLQKLNNVFADSTQKLNSIIKNLAEKRDDLNNISKVLGEQLRIETEEFEQDSELHKSEVEQQSEKEFYASEMVSESPGEQPKLIKRLVNAQDLSLSKMKELVKNQRNLLDSLLNSIREIVSKINPFEIGNLNIKGKQPLEELFLLIFELLYDETPDKFIWKQFKMTVLFKEEGSADFLYRMANFEVKEVKQPLLLKMKKLKDSEELRGYLEDPKVGEALIDIADWLEFIYHGNSLANELIAMEDLFNEAKDMVETLERNERKEMYVKNVRQQKIRETQSANDFMAFVSEKMTLMHDNYTRSSIKLANHIHYQQEINDHMVQQEILKNLGEVELDLEENPVQQQTMHNKGVNPSRF